MNSNLKIYLIKPAGFDSIDEIYAFFDSMENARAFLNRFKTEHRDLEIVERIMNPNFITNDQSDPYVVTLWKTEPNPLNCFICDHICQAEAAQKEEHIIRFWDHMTIDEGQFEILLFAPTAEGALANATAKRDLAIANGEWEKAYNAIC